MNNKKQDFYIYYILEDDNYNFLYKVRNCSKPQRTKEYKRLKNWMRQNIVYQVGYCTTEYFEGHKNKFSKNGPLY